MRVVGEAERDRILEFKEAHGSFMERK